MRATSRPCGNQAKSKVFTVYIVIANANANVNTNANHSHYVKKVDPAPYDPREKG